MPFLVDHIFLSIFVGLVAVSIPAAWINPDLFVRIFFFPLTHGIYRIRVEGRDNIPSSGPALFVSNHVSFIDGFLIGGASHRPVRFLMYRKYYEIPFVNWFFRLMGFIPISDNDSPKALIHSFEAARNALQAGQAVCIFAEGEITRHGQMLRFKKGLERIVKGLDVPIVPVHLDRVWGSIFSFEGKRVLFKWPRRIPYPVTVSFGRPMPPTAGAVDVRTAILELGVEAFKHRLAERPPMAIGFIREAKRHWFRFCIADSFGAKLNYGAALVRSKALGDALARLIADPTVGVLLPPSAPAALVNLGLSLNGKVPINLNYTASPEIAFGCADRASARTVVSSRKFLEKLGWQPQGAMLYLEDFAPNISKFKAAWDAVWLFILPSRLVERIFFGKARGGLDRLATVLFTSGSSGLPKGVMLTHANIMSNIEALAQLYQVVPTDRLLGALPFFHSFGFTGTLWFPLLTGFGVVYHTNPLDAKRIGDLIEKFHATFLLATPTFLSAYTRRIEASQLKSLKHVIVGAEKLRDDVAKGFEDKFGITPLQGYGATELSPVAAVNIPDADISGVRQRGKKEGSIGQPLPGILIKAVNPDTGRTVAPGEPGLLLVKGPNVMAGYLNDPEKTSAAIRDGFYITGDIGVIDEDGFVKITDRLSRFSKIGGEMVPHVRVEEILHQLAGTIDQTFVVSSASDPKKGERLIVFYKGFGEIDVLYKKLQDSELPKLWIPGKDSFHEVAEFPLLGSGKLDLQKLKALAAEVAKAG